MDIFVLARAVTYGVLFVSLVIIFVPARLLAWSGIEAPPAFGLVQIIGMLVGIVGALLAVWCILTFVTIGRGTPVPFDPPRRLVVSGPYRVVRNPMYIGAGTALVGAAIYYQSLALFAYAALLLIAVYIFIIVYEEPTLKRTFGATYASYCKRVNRWWPKRQTR